MYKWLILKKRLSVITLLCLLFTLLFNFTVSKVYGTNEEVKYGDVNSDGYINLEEAVKESSKPFILEGVSYSASGAVGNYSCWGI